MAGTALLGRLTWQVGTVVGIRSETSTARTLVFDVPGWAGHAAGQHLDIKLTAEDGYTASRSYSISSAPQGDRVEITVEQVIDGEVSEYLTEVVEPGDRLELRGPVGGWFVWRPEQTEPVQLIAGGSGVATLMAMVRAHAGSAAPMRLLYSTRSPDSVFYRDELEAPTGVEVSLAYTRWTPSGWPRIASRVDTRLIATSTIPAAELPTCYVCGPTGFVETVNGLLAAAGHDPDRIRTERFGPTGGTI